MTSDDSIETLRGILGDEFDAELAKKALAKHNGNLQAAVGALLDKETLDDLDETLPSYSHSERNSRISDAQLTRKLMNTPVAGVSTSIPRHPKDKDLVIDLTGDNTDEDPELKRALQLSMEGEKETVFRPTDRAPDPNWAVVPSNIVAPTAISSEDQSLAQAIEASLSTSIAEDKFEELQNEQRIRSDKRPVALRSKDQTRCYAALLLQALFFVPQIRSRISEWGVDVNEEPPADRPESLPFNLLHLFAHMDQAIMSYIVVDDLKSCMAQSTPASATDAPGDLTSDLYKKMAYILEVLLQKRATEVDTESPQNRVFHLRYAPLAAPIDNSAIDERYDTACVRVEVRGTEDRNDLVSCLSAQLKLDASTNVSIGHGELWERPHVFQPSEVIAFNLTRTQIEREPQGFIGPQIKQSKDEPGLFRYPSSVYLDQFLNENAELVAKKRWERIDMLTEVDRLVTNREMLTNFEGKDVRKNLEGTLFYYESAAARDKNSYRSAQMNVMAEKLRKILAKLKGEIEAIDDKIAYLRNASDMIFDDPMMQKHRYDLRAVLVHDGLYGRNHIYSYVNDGKVWWKTTDLHVTEVSEETVLTDSTGLHLGSGAYMLLYSRAMPDGSEIQSVQWPHGAQKIVQDQNEDMLNEVSQEFADSIRQTFGIPQPEEPSKATSLTNGVSGDSGAAQDVTMGISESESS